MSLTTTVAKEVTARIIKALEEGCAPWIRPWNLDENASGFPFNRITKKPYRGINVILLAIAGSRFTSSAWLTYKQALELGGNVRKGEKGTQIVFWKKLAITEKQTDGSEIEKQIPMMRYYTVFNVEQCDNLPAMKREEKGEFDANERAENVLTKSGAVIRHGGNSAFYSPSSDHIQLPSKEQFSSAGHYYATALHELTHWTGSEKRLAREYGKRFGDQAYAREELVAEIGAAFICAQVGIEGELRHEGYIKNWIKVLQDDSRAIFVAAGHAQKAADYIFALESKDEEKEAA